jgi:NAD(P)-dependent dehydrogenase (short-subunit alcohol dehydrogenase family)
MSQNATKATIALITGANQGIGRAVAMHLAKNHDFTVIIGSRNLSTGQVVADELQAEGCNATALQLDLMSDASITAAVTTIADKFGRLDMLVNNAGVLLDEGGNVFKALPKLPTRELFEQTFGTNVIGTACLTEALLPLLRKATRRLAHASSSCQGGWEHSALRPTTPCRPGHWTIRRMTRARRR